MAWARNKEPRITEEVRPLLAQLEAVTSLSAAKYRKNNNDAPSTSSSLSVADQRINNIKGAIRFIADIFRQLEIWEKDMKGKMGDIAKELDKALDDGNDENEFQSKLLIAEERSSDLKKSMTTADSPLQLERLEAYIRSIPYPASLPYFSSTSTSIDSDESCKLQFYTTISEEDIKILHPLLQLALVFLCIFPECSLIKRKTIYYLWILCPETRGKALDVALQVLHHGGYIKCTYKDHKPRYIDSCMINPTAHRALISILADGPYHGNRTNIYDVARRICDPLSASGCLSLEAYQGQYKSCVNVNRSYLKFERNKFRDIEDSVGLMLGRWQSSAKHHIEVENTEFLKWLGSFYSLRLLCLRGLSRITELPPSIGELISLRFLDLHACYDLQRLPVELTRLRSLEYLDTSECYFLSHMPKGIGSLPKLRVLKGFVVGGLQRSESCQLGELSELSLLEKLSINIGRGAVLEDREFAKLTRLAFLTTLIITWSPSSNGVVLTVDEMDVFPPPGLEKLDIRCFPESTLPQWLSPIKLRRLERLYIRGGKLKPCSLYQPYPLWDNVVVLRLRFLQEVNVAYEAAQLRGTFPDLDYLEFHECNDNMRTYRWTRDDSDRDFLLRL